MQYNPFREANNSYSSREIPPPPLWHPNINSLIHKQPKPVPFLSQFTGPFHFLNIHFNIILPSPTPKSSEWFLSLSFGHKNHVFSSPLPLSATCLVQLNLLGSISRILPAYTVSGISFLGKEKQEIFLLRAVKAILQIVTPTDISIGLHKWRGNTKGSVTRNNTHFQSFTLILCIQIQYIKGLGTQFASVLRTDGSTFQL